MKNEDSLKQDIEMLEREIRIARELLQKQLQNSLTFNTAAFDPTTTRQVEFFLTYCKPAPASFPNDGAERDWSKLEAAADSDIPEIDTKDLRINAWCSTSNSGFGYKQDDTVSILHVPSGIEVVVTGERSIHACRAKAMEQLEEKYAEWVKSKPVGAAEKPAGKVVHWTTPGGLSPYITVEWYGKSPSNGTPVYLTPNTTVSLTISDDQIWEILDTPSQCDSTEDMLANVRRIIASAFENQQMKGTENGSAN